MRLDLKAYVPELNKTVPIMGYNPVNNSVYLSTVYLFGTEGDDVLMYCGEEPGKVKLRVGTNLKDEDGQDIYEGDVVKNGNGVWLEVYWNSEEAAFKQRVCNRKNVEDLGYEWQGKDRTDTELQANYKTVIGNIYENPELIK